MAFDVYVGTMTRFYRRDWENIVQQMAREQGNVYKMIYAGGEPEPPPPADDVRQAVTHWCNALSEGMKPHGIGPIGWSEADTQPYFTDRPAWQGYTALLIWAAHADHPDLPIPQALPETWAEDPAFIRSVDRQSKTRFRSILEPQLWLPADVPGVFDAPTIVSEEPTCIGSVFTLKSQLDTLLAETAAKLQECKARVLPDTPPAKKPGLLGRLLGRKQPEPEPPAENLAETAEYGLEIFRALAAKACEHRLPMLLHF